MYEYDTVDTNTRRKPVVDVRCGGGMKKEGGSCTQNNLKRETSWLSYNLRIWPHSNSGGNNNEMSWSCRKSEKKGGGRQEEAEIQRTRMKSEWIPSPATGELLPKNQSNQSPGEHPKDCRLPENEVLTVTLFYGNRRWILAKNQGILVCDVSRWQTAVSRSFLDKLNHNFTNHWHLTKIRRGVPSLSFYGYQSHIYPWH